MTPRCRQRAASLLADVVIIDNYGQTAKGKAEAIALLGAAVAGNANLSVTFSETV